MTTPQPLLCCRGCYYYIVCLFWQDLTVAPFLAWNSLCSPTWPQAWSDSPASATQWPGVGIIVKHDHTHTYKPFLHDDFKQSILASFQWTAKKCLPSVRSIEILLLQMPVTLKGDKANRAKLSSEHKKRPESRGRNCWWTIVLTGLLIRSILLVACK